MAQSDMGCVAFRLECIGINFMATTEQIHQLISQLNTDTKRKAVSQLIQIGADAVDMLIDAKSIIAKHVKDGKSIDEILEANPLQKYHDDWNWGFITTERMTKQLYNDLSKSHSHTDGEAHSH